MTLDYNMSGYMFSNKLEMDFGILWPLYKVNVFLNHDMYVCVFKGDKTEHLW